jgi:hypothetical protein
VYTGDLLILSSIFGSMHAVVWRYSIYRPLTNHQLSNKRSKMISILRYNRPSSCFSRALLTKLNYLDFLLLKGQSHDKVEFKKVHGNILQIRETGFTSRDPMFEKS